MNGTEVRAERPLSNLLLAALLGSLAWHVIAALLFSTVLTVEMGTGEDIPELPPVQIDHISSTAGAGLLEPVEDTLAALQIELPQKRLPDEFLEIPSDEEVALDAGDFSVPDIAPKDEPGSGGFGIGPPGPGKGARDTEPDRPVIPFDITGEASARRIIYRPPPPQYPPECERKGIEGDVGVTFTVGPDGIVSSVTVTSLSGSTLLDQAAKEYIKKFRFERAKESSSGSVVLRFRLAEREDE
ncbi:MAG: energy transducer TonB [Planctomycetota bacterium]|nr:energy transducer TonB [Planctomycetota bacterium]